MERDFWIDVEIGRLHGVRWGSNGPALVLLHGTGLCARLWQPLAEEMAARYLVVALDLRGHGDSVKPPTGYDRLSLAADIAEAIERLDLDRPAILGHSAGATVAALVAARLPDRVGPVALVEPILQPPGPLGDDLRERGRQLAAMTERRRDTWPSRAAMVADLAGKPVFAGWQPEYLELYAAAGTDTGEDGAVRLKCPPRLEAQLYATGALLDPWPHLQSFPKPALVVRGDRSTTVTAETAERIGAGLGAGPPLNVSGAGHFVPQERPVEFVATLAPFWDAILAGDGRPA